MKSSASEPGLRVLCASARLQNLPMKTGLQFLMFPITGCRCFIPCILSPTCGLYAHFKYCMELAIPHYFSKRLKTISSLKAQLNLTFVFSHDFLSSQLYGQSSPEQQIAGLKIWMLIIHKQPLAILRIMTPQKILAS